MMIDSLVRLLSRLVDEAALACNSELDSWVGKLNEMHQITLRWIDRLKLSSVS